MKSVFIMVALALLAGCTTRTEYGECVGIADEKNPALTYKVNTTNAVVGVVFWELIAPPILVLANETFCPVGKK